MLLLNSMHNLQQCVIKFASDAFQKCFSEVYVVKSELEVNI
jgi:hypothetical protein